jgi:hypothetical protein
MADHPESGSWTWLDCLGLRILEQRLQRSRRTGYALRLGARRTKTQDFLPPAKSSEAELMQ